MTDFSDDELVSAVLDGEATDEDVARVTADPVLSARLAELRAVHDAVATARIDLPADDVREAAIAAALVASAPAPADVVDLRARRRHRTLQVASIAAAVLVVVGIIGGLIAWTGHTSRSTKTSAAASSTPPSQDTNTSATSQEGASAPAPAPSGATAASPATQAGDLGSFSTVDSLVARARTAAAQFASDDSPAAAPQQAPLDTDSTNANRSAAITCGAQPDIRLEASAMLNGQSVLVVVRGEPSPQTVDVYDTSCVLLFSQPP